MSARLNVINDDLRRLHEQIAVSKDAVEKHRVQNQIDALIAALATIEDCADESEDCDELGEGHDNSLHDRMGSVYQELVDKTDGILIDESAPLKDVYLNVPENLKDIEVEVYRLVLVPEEHREEFLSWDQSVEE